MFQWNEETENLIQTCEMILNNWNRSDDNNVATTGSTLIDSRTNDNKQKASAIETKTPLLSLKVYRLGWILYGFHEYNEHQKWCDTKDDIQQQQLNDVYRVIQSVIHDILTSVSIHYRQRIVYELHIALQNVASDMLSFQITKRSAKQIDSNIDGNQNTTDNRKNEIEEKQNQCTKALQSIVELHESSSLMAQSLLAISITNNSDNTDISFSYSNLKSLLKILFDVYNYYKIHSIVQSGYAVLQLLRHILLPSLTEENKSVETNWIIPLDNFLQYVQLMQQHKNELESNSSTQKYNLWDDFVTHMDAINSTWIESLVISRYVSNKELESDHADYIKSLLNTTAMSSISDYEELKQQIAYVTRQNVVSTTDVTSVKRKASSASASVDEIQRRIDKVRQVFPQYGEGFIEVALGCNDGNVESTVACLLNDRKKWPAVLQVTDTSLPRRRLHTDIAPINIEEEMEAKATAKALIVASEKEQERKALLLMNAMRIDDRPTSGTPYDTNREFAGFDHDEYDDDYDDQYDDQFYDEIIEGAIIDDPLYDRYDYNGAATKKNNNKRSKDEEYEAIKTYNNTVKEIVSDNQFWEMNRNTNRQQQPTRGMTTGISENNDDEEEYEGNDTNHRIRTYRGPDRGRGGRIPRPRQQQSINDSKATHVNNTDSSGDNVASGGGRNNVHSTTNSGRGGRGRGRGGRSSGGSNGIDRNIKSNDTKKSIGDGSTAATTTSSDSNGASGQGGPLPVKNSRQKERQLEKRREQQKMAMYNKSG